MYDPVKDGIPKNVESVLYVEIAPPETLREFVHCLWELRTLEDLAEDFILHAMPDACVNFLFNQRDPRIAGVTQLHTSPVSLNLGSSFHYAGIQLFPGVWRGDPNSSVDHFVGEPYEGNLRLIEIGKAASVVDSATRVELFADFVTMLHRSGLVAPNPVTAAILTNLDTIHRVSDMAQIAALSPRQLQRVLKDTTGFTPHDLLKVLRVQHSFRHEYLLHYADQSHFVHSFRKVTGYTPGAFKKTFDV